MTKRMTNRGNVPNDRVCRWKMGGIPKGEHIVSLSGMATLVMEVTGSDSTIEYIILKWNIVYLF